MNLAPYIDHTNLKPEAAAEDIKKLCEEALRCGFASVCVNSSRAALAAELLKGSSVAVCAVVGFPLGAASSAAKAFEAKKAAEDGASEIDMVINIGFIKDGTDEEAANRKGDNRDMPPHERGENTRLSCRDGGWRALRKNLHRLLNGGGDRGRRQVDEGNGGNGHEGQGCRRHPRRGFCRAPHHGGSGPHRGLQIGRNLRSGELLPVVSDLRALTY